MRKRTLLFILAAAVTLTPASLALGSVGATESYPALLAQINSRSVSSAVLNRKAHDVRVTLSDGTQQLVLYPSRDTRTLATNLRRHGAKVKYTRRRARSLHHTLRYVAGGVVIAVLAVGGGVFFFTRRRRPTGETSEGQTVAP